MMSAEGAKRTEYANLSGKRTEYGISVFIYFLRMSAETECPTELDVAWKSMERSVFYNFGLSFKILIENAYAKKEEK